MRNCPDTFRSIGLFVFLSRHRSDQMSEGSQVFKVILCVQILTKVTTTADCLLYTTGIAARAAKNWEHQSWLVCSDFFGREKYFLSNNSLLYGLPALCCCWWQECRFSNQFCSAQTKSPISVVTSLQNGPMSADFGLPWVMMQRIVGTK